MTTIQCPKCGTNALVGDSFCEECGTPLVAVQPVSILNSITKCAKCGAEPEQIDAEGFCIECGFRREVREGDHIEVNCGLHLGGVSDRGLRHHRNEDYLACATIAEKDAYVIVVCDGVSSSSEPDKAAKVAALEASQFLQAAVQSDISLAEGIKSAVAAALVAVSNIPYTKSADAEPPSTTIVAAVVQNHSATIGWLGDSRAYWIAAENSQRLTRDDSWMSNVVASGQMTEAEASKSDKAHAITRWLGADAENNSQPSIVNFDIPGSGYLLLCTDGLWNYAPTAQQITKLVQQTRETNPVLMSRSLVEFARSQGGHDNITVAILSLLISRFFQS